MSSSFFQDLLTTITERGRALVERREAASSASNDLLADCRRLLSGRGEASGVAIARNILNAYQRFSEERKTAFFEMLNEHFAPDHAALMEAFQRYRDDPVPENFAVLFAACEPPRQELFRRLNQVPSGTAALVSMRKELLDRLADHPSLAAVDHDLAHLLASWFNRGFLVLKPIDWATPASILERIIRYEAVHEISDWDELRRRLEPPDRRCFAFFHPAVPDDPLIFVEVALTDHVPGAIRDILVESRPMQDASAATTAVFYSISNCQEGLRGISFGNFLIKQVVEDLAKTVGSLKTFVTLSPVPRFLRWLNDASTRRELATAEWLSVLDEAAWHEDDERAETVKKRLMPLAAHYFLNVKREDGQPLDPVARFHLGNGARLERINWLGDVSAKGMRQAAGLMVNYGYDLEHIEENHERYANQGVVAAASGVRRLAKVFQKHGNVQ